MKIQVECRDNSTEIQAPSGAKLLEYLQQHSLPVNAACGGKGSCHKCRVRLKSGFLAVTPSDRRAFTASELAQGWRLSCQALPRTNLELVLPGAESLRSGPRIMAHPEAIAAVSPSSTLILVADLGSTGVVVALAEKGQTQPLVEAHLLNKQVLYGADVMTRLHSAQKLGLLPLRSAIDQTLRTCLQALEEAYPDLWKRVVAQPLICAGNSAMTSLIQNWNIDSLATAPFQPFSRESAQTSLSDGRTVQNPPLLSGFVGGDTVAGILSLEKEGARSPWMLVDIGTNTEIVIKNQRGELWFSSAPAGPAFEGGNIHQGMRAETGAIARARYHDGRWTLQVLGKDVARGICGSGLIDILSEALRAELISRDGFLPHGKLSVTENISLLADDVREFQLAKAATRTAIELLIERAQVQPDTLYLAGSFAEHLDLRSVDTVGLLPPKIPRKILGNVSLKGTLIWASLSEAEKKSFCDEIESARKPVELALQDDFQERFIAELDFPVTKS